ncbi:hypothetical protein RB200_12515 [Streptomyces sp. PmtG]
MTLLKAGRLEESVRTLRAAVALAKGRGERAALALAEVNLALAEAALRTRGTPRGGPG